MRFVSLTAIPAFFVGLSLRYLRPEAGLREGGLTARRAFALASLRSEPHVLPPIGCLRTGLETNAKPGVAGPPGDTARLIHATVRHVSPGNGNRQDEPQ